MSRVRAAFVALRGFVHGFLGLRAMPSDSESMRRRLRETSERRETCC